MHTAGVDLLIYNECLLGEGFAAHCLLEEGFTYLAFPLPILPTLYLTLPCYTALKNPILHSVALFGTFWGGFGQHAVTVRHLKSTWHARRRRNRKKGKSSGDSVSPLSL